MEKYKILLELALHRYDEVNRRNEIIDSKSKSMIAFIGVMLTIEFSAIPALINIFNKTPITNGVRILLFFRNCLNLLLSTINCLFYFSS